MRAIFTISLCLIVALLQGQEAFYVHMANDGIYLRWKGERSNSLEGYHVYRKSGDADWERLTSEALTLPSNEQLVKASIPGKEDLFYAMLGLKGGPVTAADVLRASQHEMMGGLFEATIAADADMAALLGERFVDASAQKGTRYSYRIAVLKNGAESVLHEKGPLPPYQALAAAKAPAVQVISGDGELTLKCSPPAAALKSGDVVSWQVYRSENANGPFRRVNLSMGFPTAMHGSQKKSEPLSLGFTDRFLENGKEYFYRVRMVNVAGVAGPESPTYKGVPAKPESAEVLLAWDVEALARKVVLHWQTHSRDLPYTIMQAPHRNGPYRAAHRGMLREGADSWLDVEYRAGELRYYYMQVRHENERIWRSDTLDAFYGERLPPEAPPSLTASLRDTFLVDLQWDASPTAGSSYDLERFTGNNPRSAVKVNARPLTGTHYTDTLRRHATGEYRYRVRAVSAALQHSKPSPVAAVIVPDFTPPQSPIAWRLDREGDEGVMTWHPVPEEDLEKYQVYWSVDEGAWQMAHEGAETTYRFAIGERSDYRMAVRAVDISGNEGAFSDTLKLRIREKAPDAPAILTAEKRGKGLEVKWEESDTTRIHQLVLTRIDPVSGRRLDIWQGKARVQVFFDKYASPQKHWRFELTAYDRKWRKGAPAVFLYEPPKSE